MPKVAYPSGDPVVAPTGILSRQPNHQTLDLRSDPRPAGQPTLAGAVEIGGDQLAIPAQNGVGGGDAGDLLQQFPAQAFADFGKRSSLGTGQPEAWQQMGFQDAVLGQQVLILQEQFLVDEPGHEGQKTGDAGDVSAQTP